MADPTPTTRAVVAALTAWFAERARDLPWRRDRTPYRVWISEVMLQQTRATTVGPFFERFLQRFPDVRALAAAELEDVLKAWEGLGYYRRARLLHRAAERVVAEHGGTLPDTEAALRELPGFGPYTAAAVASLAFGRPTVAVDGNVRRVGARVLGSALPRDATIRAAFGAWPSLAPDPATVTEALIELGARVCTPRSPECGACPLRPVCQAAALGTPEAFPAREARTPPPTRRRFAIATFDDRGVWLERRPEDGMLGGMWGVPQRGDAPDGETLGTVTHVYSHFRLELTVVATSGTPESGAERIAWDRVPDLPISGVDAKVLALLHPARKRVARAPERL